MQVDVRWILLFEKKRVLTAIEQPGITSSSSRMSLISCELFLPDQRCESPGSQLVSPARARSSARPSILAIRGCRQILDGDLSSDRAQHVAIERTSSVSGGLIGSHLGAVFTRGLPSQAPPTARGKEFYPARPQECACRCGVGRLADSTQRARGYSFAAFGSGRLWIRGSVMTIYSH